MDTQLVGARRLAAQRSLIAVFALAILLSASVAVQQSPGKGHPQKGHSHKGHSHKGHPHKGHPHKGGDDLARYILPPGNYG